MDCDLDRGTASLGRDGGELAFPRVLPDDNGDAQDVGVTAVEQVALAAPDVGSETLLAAAGEGAAGLPQLDYLVVGDDHRAPGGPALSVVPAWDSAGGSPVVLRSTVANYDYELVAGERGQVHVTVRLSGDVLHEFDLDTLAAGVERTLASRLSGLGMPHRDARSRELEAYRILAEGRRVVLDGSAVHRGTSADEHAERFLDSSEIDRLLLEDAKHVGFSTDPLAGVTLILAKLSALLSEPVYVYLCGPASALKTYYADLTATLTPPEMLKHLTDLTPKALYYGATDLAHHVIALDEMDLKGRGLAVDLKVLRMLFSKGWADMEVTRGGTSIRRRVNGPVMVMQTTTAVKFDDQDLL